MYVRTRLDNVLSTEAEEVAEAEEVPRMLNVCSYSLVLYIFLRTVSF
jgi:hypothetical protein